MDLCKKPGFQVQECGEGFGFYLIIWMLTLLLVLKSNCLESGISFPKTERHAVAPGLDSGSCLV